MTDALAEPQLVSTPEAAHLLGVPEKEFTRLAKVLNLTAARPRTRKQPRYWARELVAQLAAGPEGAEVREAAARKERIVGLRAELEARYPDWRQALGPAADALFNFNRFSKWATCSRLRRHELYDLKNKCLRLFYDLGLAHEVTVHAAGDEEECEACAGTGTDWRGQACAGCGGRGVVRGEQGLQFLHFCFRIDGRWFNWHQPRQAVAWPVELTERLPDTPAATTWQPRGAEKPIELAGEEEFLRAEACVRFVLDRAREEKEQRQREESRRHNEERRRQAEARRGGQQPPPA